MLRPAGGWRKTRRRCQDCDDRSASSWGRGPPRTVGSEREKQPTLAIQLWDVGTVNREILFFLVVLDKGLSCGVVGIRANYRPVARDSGQQQHTWCQSPPQPPDPLKVVREFCGTQQSEKTPTSASPAALCSPAPTPTSHLQCQPTENILTMAPMRFSDYLCTELRAEAVHAALQHCSY